MMAWGDSKIMEYHHCCIRCEITTDIGIQTGVLICNYLWFVIMIIYDRLLTTIITSVI